VIKRLINVEVGMFEPEFDGGGAGGHRPVLAGQIGLAAGDRGPVVGKCHILGGQRGTVGKHHIIADGNRP
jgi:hypothetical protein